MLKVTIEIEGLDELLAGAVAMVANWDRPEAVAAVDQAAKSTRRSSAKTKPAAEPSPNHETLRGTDEIVYPDYRDEVPLTSAEVAEKSRNVAESREKSPEVAATSPPVATPADDATWMTPESFGDYVARFTAAPKGPETPEARDARIARSLRLKAVYEKYFPGQKRTEIPDNPGNQRKFAAIVAEFQAAEASQL